MLRAHRDVAPDGTTTLQLEGSLSGPWIAEVRHLVREMEGQPLRLDLASLVYADREGAELLRELGSRFVVHGRSPFVAALLARGQR